MVAMTPSPGSPVTPPDAPLAVPAPRSRSAWDAWGTHTTRLPTGAKALVATVLPGRAHPVPRRTAPRLTPSRLDDADVSVLAEIVGAAEVTLDDDVRTLHLGGKSTPDLLARRLGDPQSAPDAVVSPGSHAEVFEVLAACGDRGIAVVPFGGGTSVVGGVDPVAGAHTRVIALDLIRTAALWDLDETSLLATLGAGTTGPQAEELLNVRGYTLGHFPQSFEYASIGGYAATRSSGQASRGYGRFDDLVHALRVATPVGELRLGRAPASAAGPDLRELFLGSEGAFGVITEVTLRIRPLAGATAYGAWTFADFAAGAEALRELDAARHPPDRRAAQRRERDARQCADGRAPPTRSRRSGGCDLRGRRCERGGSDPRDHRRALSDSRRHGTRRGPGTLVGARALRVPRAARHAAGHRGSRRDARDGDHVGEPRSAQGVRHRCPQREPQRGRHEADRDVPHLARLPRGRLAVLHGRRRTHDRPGGAMGTGEGCRLPRDRRRLVGRSPTITPSAATTARTSSKRSASSASPMLRAVKATVDPHGIMNPGVLVPPADSSPQKAG